MVDVLTLRSGETVSLGVEHIIVRRNAAGYFGLFGVMDDDPDEFEVTSNTYISEARAVDAAHSFARSMQVETIYVVLDGLVS